MKKRLISKSIIVYCLGQSVLLASESGQDVDYWTIEGMRSQEYSIGIFIFMIIGVLVFFGIIIKLGVGTKNSEKLKTGEKVLFTWIILGTLGAVIFGAMQLLQGRLF